MTEKLQIRGGRVIDPAQGVDEVTDLFIADGVVQALGKAPDGFTPDLLLEAKGCVVTPGFVDLSARLREPGLEHKATIRSESMAAVAGGITTLVIPPDTLPVVDTPAVVQWIFDRAKAQGFVRLHPVGALTRGLKGQDLSEMSALKAAGCRAVSNAHHKVANTLVLRRSLEYAASHDLLVIVRPEDPDLKDGGCAHEGPISARMGLKGIPYAAETVAVAQVLALIEQTGARVHFAQISSARAMRSIWRAQEKGFKVTADVAIHQLHLTEEALEGFDAGYHLSPPLRTKEDLEALRVAVKEGVIGSVCSDHQPHEPDAKLDAFPATEPGMAGLETLLPLTLALVREGVMTLPRAIQSLTQSPAEVLGLSAGTLAPGSLADITIFDPLGEWILQDSTWRSLGGNTPFGGQTLKGRVIRTLLEGRVVFDLNFGEAI